MKTWSVARGTAILMLTAAVTAHAQQRDPAEQLLDSATAHQLAHDAFYIHSNDLVRAKAELETALREYDAGALAYPDKRGFNFGLGILHNIRGEYPPAARAFRRELDILAKIKNDALNRDRFIAASGLAEACEGLADYTNAVRYFTEALTYTPDDKSTQDAIERCRRLQASSSELRQRIAAARVPEGTTVDVIYDHAPRTYLEPVTVEYRLEMIGGQVHVRLKIPVAYGGQATNRDAVERRLKKIAALVEECFARSELHLHLSFTFVKPKRLSPSRGVTIWDHYLPEDRRTGDARNWAILSASKLELTPEMAASTVAHEVGHMLGLGHPVYYPEKPYSDIMTAGYPWAGIGCKRVVPDDAISIAYPLLAPPDVRGVLKRTDDLRTARKLREVVKMLDTARQRCPGDMILQIAYANAAFDAADYQAAVDGYSQVLKSTPTDDQTLLLRGVSYARLKEYGNAIRDFTLIVAQPSGGVHAAAYCERANVYEMMGQQTNAVADRARAEAAVTDPQPDPEARKTLGLPPMPSSKRD